MPSKRWQAFYTGPDGQRHTAPSTFETKMDAEAWLIAERVKSAAENWLPPKLRRAAEEASRPPTLTEYAADWLPTRKLKPRTQALYRRILDRDILPTLGDTRVDLITPAQVRQWHAGMNANTPTKNAHAYQLLRAILTTAVTDDLLAAHPCRIRGAGVSRSQHRAEPATLPELTTIVEHMPDRLRLAVLVAAWCGLRQGEVLELRRKDVDQNRNVLRVRRAVAHVPGTGPVVGTPKSHAGIRDVSIPPHLLPEVERHLNAHVPPDRDSLLFPGQKGGHLAPSVLYRAFKPARDAAKRPELRFHDLRHTGATLAAATGATLAELMNRLGHSSVGASLRYQHAAKDRDAEIARLLSKMITEPDTQE